MKIIGLIGGMSWESTVTYYRLINEEMRRRLGGLHSAKIILYSVDFHEIEAMQKANAWDDAGALLADAARALAVAGADFLLVCTNTMHKVAPAIEAAVSIPLLHIADATADEIRQAGMTAVGLLGTRFTMEEGFYRDRLQQRHGLSVFIPPEQDREIVHRVIYEELCMGNITSAARQNYRRIMAELVTQGAQAIILGCTEISLLVTQTDSPVPIFDTTSIHASRAVNQALVQVMPEVT